MHPKILNTRYIKHRAILKMWIALDLDIEWWDPSPGEKNWNELCYKAGSWNLWNLEIEIEKGEFFRHRLVKRNP